MSAVPAGCLAIVLIAGTLPACTRQSPGPPIPTGCGTENQSCVLPVEAHVYALWGIEHGAAIYEGRVVRSRALMHASQCVDASQLEVHVLKTIWGPQAHRIAVDTGVPVPFTDGILCAPHPPASSLSQGTRLTLILLPPALNPHTPAVYQIGATQMWLAWGNADPLVLALEKLARIVGEERKAGESPVGINSNSAVRAADLQVDLWAQWHSNSPPIRSADDAAVWVGRLLCQGEVERAAPGEIRAARRAAPVLTARRDVKSGPRAVIVAGLAHRLMIAPREQRTPWVRCLGKVVLQGSTPAAGICLRKGDEERLRRLLVGMERSGANRPPLSQRIQAVVTWLTK